MPAGVLINRTTTPAVDGPVYGHGMGTGPGEEAAPGPPSPTTGTAFVAQMANGGLESVVKSQGVAAAMGAAAAATESSSSSPLLGRCGTAALPGQVPASSSLVPAGRKSMNMTECVHVASSEHVAEIVGRQGSKIKALRAKTNTYIKTPVRGEEPVFVVTGRKEDVAAAKKEILAIAEHFSQIRAGRLGNNVGGRAPSSLGFFNADIPGHVTIHVRVPYRVVGLVVGPKGATIKRIQQDSQTYIITPSRDREPIFEVSGLSENVEKARREIESYIALRTGTGVSDAALQCGGSAALAIPRPFSCELEMPERDVDSQTLLGSMFKPQLSGPLVSSALASFNNSLNLGMVNKSNGLHGGGIDPCGGPSHGLLTANKKIGSLPQGCIYAPKVLTDYAAYGSGKTTERPKLPYPNANLLTNEFWSQINNAEAPWLLDGLSAYFPSAENISALQNDALADVCNAPTALNSLNFTASRKLCGTSNGTDVDRTGKDGIARLTVNGGGPGYVGKVHSGSLGSESNSPSISPTDSVGSPSQGRRRCFVCGDNTIVAALVPCGHNLFCMDCAQAVLDRKDQLENRCPVCQQMASLAVRILS